MGNDFYCINIAELAKINRHNNALPVLFELIKTSDVCGISPVMVAELTEKLCLSRKTISVALSHLESINIIEKVKVYGDGRRHAYRISKTFLRLKKG